MVDAANPIFPPPLLLTLLFAALLLAGLVLQLWLATRQIRHVARHRAQVPAAFASAVSLAAHQKAADYTLAKARLSLIELAWGAIVLIGWTLLGGLDALNQALRQTLGTGMGQQLALVATFVLVGSVLDAPFSWYRTFVLEQRFGFNRTTFKLWLQDTLKAGVLGALIGLPLVAVILWLMQASGGLWWLWAWAVWIGFNLVLLLIYPTWIAPWFNKFQPLEDRTLQARVQALMQRCGFTAQGFFVMDGSRRSAHANAYFTGFGRAKRVVFYDTLLQRLNPDEVDAVLAHELGHFSHRHVPQRMVSLFAMSLAALALLGWLSSQAWFYVGLGVQPNMDGPNDALALLLFALTLPVASFFLTPLFALLSRRHEFEADAYAAAQTDARALGQALLKLYEDNASTLTPDPVYVAFYYSHPPATQRLARLGA